VLLPLDQAEELARAEGEGADVLCDYLRAALLPPPSNNGDDASAGAAMIALTARSDSFPELHTARRFAGLDARCADIRPVPLHRFDDVIEKPAARYGVEIEPGLIEAMIEDAPGADALPLFAFAMENPRAPAARRRGPHPEGIPRKARSAAPSISPASRPMPVAALPSGETHPSGGLRQHSAGVAALATAGESLHAPVRVGVEEARALSGAE
jgi:hypothetical protein